MPVKDLHEEAFDESTIAKLEIFESYAEAWLPTFIMQGTPTICIFDFFAGNGYDNDGTPGSTIRILHTVRKYLLHIFRKNTKIIIYTNEYKKKKFTQLKKSCEDYLEEHKDVGRAIKMVYYNEDFYKLFPTLTEEIRRFPSLVYLDQNGIKAISPIYFNELEKSPQTDFLYFISSSYVLRFGNTTEFKTHLNIDINKAKKNSYKYIHKSIIEQLRNQLPHDTNLKLYPFSLKKGNNIHGIVFGATHIRAVDKFLSIAWSQNKLNGEANFDINDDTPKSNAQLEIFGYKKLNKIEQFQNTVKDRIMSGSIETNYDLLNFTLQEGHVGRHADECLRELKREKKIFYEGLSPLVTYDSAYKNKKIIKYQILKK